MYLKTIDVKLKTSQNSRVRILVEFYPLFPIFLIQIIFRIRGQKFSSYNPLIYGRVSSRFWLDQILTSLNLTNLQSLFHILC